MTRHSKIFFSRVFAAAVLLLASRTGQMCVKTFSARVNSAYGKQSRTDERGLFCVEAWS